LAKYTKQSNSNILDRVFGRLKLGGSLLGPFFFYWSVLACQVVLGIEVVEFIYVDEVVRVGSG
jgi:hypothetical protein